MKPLSIALAALVSLTATALCDDPPAPAPAPPADGAKPAAKPERKVDPAGAKALERYTGAMHFLTGSGVKSASARGEVEEAGMKFGILPKWSLEKGFDFDVEVSPELRSLLEKQDVPEESMDDVLKGKLGMTIGFSGVNSVFEAPGRDWEHYHIAVTATGDDEVVTLTAADDKANSDSRKYTFGKDGLIKSIEVDPKDDGGFMGQVKSLGGMQSTIRYEKRGSRSVITGRTLKLGDAEIGSEFTYFPSESGPFLLKQAALTSPTGNATVVFHDFTVDGKLIEATKSAPKKSEEAKPESEKPAAPAPAPKEEPK